MIFARRDFGRWVAGGAIAWAAPPLFAAPRSKKSPVVLGVQSYSFRDRPLAEALAAMADIGFATCELWQGHLEPQPLREPTPEPPRAYRERLRKWRVETPLSELEKVAARFKKAGVPLCAYNYSFKDDFGDDEIERGFAMAKALGVTAITASAHQKVLERVAPRAAKHRIKVAVHNHSKIAPNEFATPQDFENAISGPGRELIAINLDVGHFTAANFDPLPFIEKHHDRIVTLHLKDRKRDQGPTVPFGEGDAPLKEILALLRKKRWRIPANVEYEYKGGDTVEEVKRCLDYCRQALLG